MVYTIKVLVMWMLKGILLHKRIKYRIQTKSYMEVHVCSFAPAHKGFKTVVLMGIL